MYVVARSPQGDKANSSLLGDCIAALRAARNDMALYFLLTSNTAILVEWLKGLGSTIGALVLS